MILYSFSDTMENIRPQNTQFQRKTNNDRIFQTKWNENEFSLICYSLAMCAFKQICDLLLELFLLFFVLLIFRLEF